MELFVALVLILGFLTACDANKGQPSLPISGRSSRWDQALNQRLRQKRGADNWQSGRPCTLGDVTQYDELGRRNSGLLANVQNQLKCGSCWAFASAHAVTDTRSLQANRKLDLISAQYTTRCAARPETFGHGCCGDWPANALSFYLRRGTVTDQCLPYDVAILKGNPNLPKQQNPLPWFGNCLNEAPLRLLAVLGGYLCFDGFTDNFLINILNKNYAVVATIGANNELMYQYTCGILCDTPLTKCYHSVEIVDYGTDNTTGVDFWVIKNSWGAGWGESGYFRVKRGGELGIGRPGYPIWTTLVRVGNTTSSLPLSSNCANTDALSCAPVDVSEPENDMISMSAAEFALQNLINDQLIECPNASSYSQLSFQSASKQVVAGLVMMLEVSVYIEGCGTKSCKLTVCIDLNESFNLTDYTCSSITSNATALTSVFLCLFAVVVLCLLIII